MACYRNFHHNISCKNVSCLERFGEPQGQPEQNTFQRRKKNRVTTPTTNKVTTKTTKGMSWIGSVLGNGSVLGQSQSWVILRSIKDCWTLASHWSFSVWSRVNNI